MSWSRKYDRTYHYPFSLGTTGDDRIHADYWADLSRLEQVVHTEKLDGENTCLNRYGVFARSHAAPTEHPWARYLVERWEGFKHQLGELEIFGENLYAIHSIRYRALEHHFFVFAVREGDRWLSWEEVGFYAALLDFPTVPELTRTAPLDRNRFEQEVIDWAGRPSRFDSADAHTEADCTCEGIVTRNLARFHYFNSEERYPDYVPFDDRRAAVVILSGLPGAGKDTYIRRHLRDWPVLSLDELRRELGVKPTDSQGTGHAVQLAKERARAHLRRSERFVWNATNLTRTRRGPLIELFAGYGARVHLIYLEPSYEALLRQNADRETAVPVSVIDRMIDHMEPPSPVEAHEVTWEVT